jgi:hypothetical protein
VVFLCEFPTLSPLQYTKTLQEPIKGYSRIKGNFQLNEIAYKLECNLEAIEIIKSLEDNLGNPPILKNYDYDSIALLRQTFHEREQLDKNKNSLIN